MKKVAGIGGFFFRARDPQVLSQWYEKHLGIDNEGSSSTIWEQQAGPTVFAPFAQDTDYFGRPDQAWMLNLRVNDLDGLLAELQAAGVRIDQQRMDESYGRFAWIYDPEDNKIELWEPKDLAS